jgi:hypothetical protein
MALALALVALGLAACLPAKPPAQPPIITTTPALFPSFERGVLDYVNRCDPSTATTVQVDASADMTVSVDGSPPSSGSFTVQVTQDVDKQFTIDVTTSGTTTTHHVRCLPSDFPTWSVQKNGEPQAAFYATNLVRGFGPPSYSAVFDTNGVPVWWLDPKQTFLLAPLPNKNFAILKIGGGMEEYSLSGQLMRSLNTVGGPSDFHDVLLLPNGHYVLATLQGQPCSLAEWGLGALPKTCVNHVFQELDPATGLPVWTWDTSLHIPVTETTANWQAEQTSRTRDAYDPWHYNSVEDTGDGFIISFRHLDAVYKIDKTTGAIVWKLGGTARPESLQIVNDPLNGTAGQHDARLLDNGNVTIYDNGTLGLGPHRQPRAVRYALDLQAKTATLTQQIQDPDVTLSGCCGSARRLPDANWVTGWGGTSHITEHTPAGSRVFRIAGTFVYRGLPLLPGEFTTDEFRAGMDAKYASGVTAQGAESSLDVSKSPVGASIDSLRCCLPPP